MSVTPGIVVFDPAQFVTAFPAFAFLPVPVLTANFNTACLYLNNTLCSIVCDEPTRANLLNLITAHVTALLNGVNGQPPSGVVGRVSQATQGSVSGTFEYSTEVTDSQAWWIQTPWGAAAWQALLPYRTARYVTGSCDFGGFAGDWSDAWPQ